MKTRNRLLAAILTLVMIVGMLPISAFAENDAPATRAVGRPTIITEKDGNDVQDITVDLTRGVTKSFYVKSLDENSYVYNLSPSNIRVYAGWSIIGDVQIISINSEGICEAVWHANEAAVRNLGVGEHTLTVSYNSTSSIYASCSANFVLKVVEKEKLHVADFSPDTAEANKPYTVSGRILDESNDPVAGLYVQVHNQVGRGYNATTDTDGRFSVQVDMDLPTEGGTTIPVRVSVMNDAYAVMRESFEITFTAPIGTTRTVTVLATPAVGGTVTGSGTATAGERVTLTATAGERVTLTATANENYVFDGWYDGTTKVSGDESYTFTVTENVTLWAKFKLFKEFTWIKVDIPGVASIDVNEDWLCNISVRGTVGNIVPCASDEISVKSGSQSVGDVKGPNWNELFEVCIRGSELGPGEHTIVISYAGDGDHLPCSESIKLKVVGKKQLHVENFFPGTAKVNTPYTISGRIVDENGDPYSGQKLSFAIQQGESSYWNIGTATTDADGRFSCEITTRLPAAPASRRINIICNETETHLKLDEYFTLRFTDSPIHTVTFKDGDTVLFTQTVESGDTATRPTPSPTKEGQVFKGWCSDESLQAYFNFSQPITADITVYAKFVPITTITKLTISNYPAEGILKAREIFAFWGFDLTGNDNIGLSYLGSSQRWEKEDGNVVAEFDTNPMPVADYDTVYVRVCPISLDNEYGFANSITVDGSALPTGATASVTRTSDTRAVLSITMPKTEPDPRKPTRITNEEGSEVQDITVGVGEYIREFFRVSPTSSPEDYLDLRDAGITVKKGTQDVGRLYVDSGKDETRIEWTLSGEDVATLGVGDHALTISYPGKDTYTPCSASFMLKIIEKEKLHVADFSPTVAETGKPYTVSGRILDESDNPVPDLNVSVFNQYGRGYYTKTDQNGYFSVVVDHRPPENSQKIQVQVVVYKSENYAALYSYHEIEFKDAPSKTVDVTITGKTASEDYDGTEKSVSGFGFTAKDSDNGDVSGVTVTLKSAYTGADSIAKTDAGEYDMGLKAEYFDVTLPDGYTLGTVTVSDGKLSIAPYKLGVEISGKRETKPFNNAEQSVTGFTVALQGTLPAPMQYTEADVDDNGSAVAKGTQPGTYPMGLDASKFTNKNKNFDVMFIVAQDGQLVIEPAQPIKHTVTYIVANGTWADGTTTPKTEEVEDGQSPSQIPTGMIPAENYEGGAWSPNPSGATITDTASFTYTFTAKQNPPQPTTKHTVTYIVVNGTWADGTNGPKTEEVEDGQSPTQIPTGMIASEGFEGGAWSPNPSGATITDTASFTYTFTAKQPQPTTKHTVTYIVVNGTWADGTKTNKTEEVEDGQSPANIPSGMLPDTNYEGGAWSPNPSGAAITDNTTFTYSFTAKQPQPSTISYTAKDGSGNTIQSVTWQKGSGKNLDLTFKRSEDDHLTYGLFGSLEIGGVTVGSANYGASEGSLKLSIKPEYLETLSVGDHTVKVNFQDGSATVKLTVKAAATQPTPKPSEKPTSPKTGDESNLALWSSLMFLSVAAMIVLLLYARKRKTEK